LRTWLQGKSVFGVNLDVNWKKLKSRDLIGFLGGLIGLIRDLIVRILKFDGLLRTWLKKSKTNDQTEKQSYIKISYSHQTFTSYFFQQTQ
jgi:hypothetical protein